MNLEKVLLFLYMTSPFVAGLFPLPKRLRDRNAIFSSGVIASAFRVLLLCFLSTAIISAGKQVSISSTLVTGYPLDFVLSLDAYRYGFLLTMELCFLLAHWMSAYSSQNQSANIISLMICFAQGFSSLFVASDNAVATGALQLLTGTVFFYLIRFSMSGANESVGDQVSRRMYILYFLLGLLMIAWGITEFGERELRFARGSGSNLGLMMWMALVLLAVPLAPWSRWFGLAVEHLPESVTLTLVTVLSAVALKFASLFSTVYPDLSAKQKALFYALGIIGCAFSISGLFAARSRRRMLGSLPSFFFSLILVAMGVSTTSLVLSAYFICLFVPVFTGLVLYASVLRVSSPVHKVFVGLLFALVLGVPGTPVYQIFAGIGARSLEMGVGYTIVFGLLWFFYFYANVYICRRIFMDPKPPEMGVRSDLEAAPISFASYGVFLIFFLILITQIAGRLL